jgi:tocopherol O-methyltransferase
MATPTEIREHYDSLSLIYRTFWGEHLHHGYFDHPKISAGEAQISLLDHCSRMLTLRGGEHILDIGCGFGATLRYLAHNFNAHGLGLTISPKQALFAKLQTDKSDLADNLRFIVADAERFQFPRERFDLIWIMESSEHFADKSAFFEKASASLRPGGKLILASWTAARDSKRVQDVANAFLCPELWTAAQYRSAVKLAGLTVQTSEDLTAKVVPTWTICKQRVDAINGTMKLLPQKVQKFIAGIEIILDAYNSGELTYTVIVARKTTSA